MTERAEDRNGPSRGTMATHLVRIATDLFTFHRAANILAAGGEVVSEGRLYARPRGNAEVRRELEDIRPALLTASSQWAASLVRRLLLRIANHVVPLRPGRSYPRPNDGKTKHKGKGRSQLPAKLAA